MKSGESDETMQLFGDSDILYLVRIIRLSWIGQVNRMHSKRKFSQPFNNNLKGRRVEKRPKTDGRCVQTDINKCKFKNWKER